jgi:hypothetical protein
MQSHCTRAVKRVERVQGESEKNELLKNDYNDYFLKMSLFYSFLFQAGHTGPAITPPRVIRRSPQFMGTVNLFTIFLSSIHCKKPDPFYS